MDSKDGEGMSWREGCPGNNSFLRKERTLPRAVFGTELGTMHGGREARRGYEVRFTLLEEVSDAGLRNIERTWRP